MGLHDWFRRFARTNHEPSIPSGWTDEMSVELGAGHTVEDLVDYIFLANEQSREGEMLIAELGAEFGLSSENAALSIDRVCGGIVRARTGNRANCPDRIKDPIAWASFQRTIAKR